MKVKSLIVLAICFITLSSCKLNETKNLSAAKQDNITNVNTLDYVEKTKAFLEWYKSNFEEILSIQLVELREEGATSQYRVNFENVNRYLTLLKSSSYFSDKFLETMKKYFESGDKNLVELKQNDGPPRGFEYDLLLYTQEPESLLETIKKVKYEIVKKTESYTTVKVDNDLSFMFDRKGLIERISK